jgi:heme oxygenase
MEVSEKFDKIPDKRYNKNMERQNLINSLLAKAENQRLLAHGKNVVDMTFKNINELDYSNNLMMIESRYKDDLATIDTLGMDIAEVESQFDNSTIG